jgi:serine O-acetyltransferase
MTSEKKSPWRRFVDDVRADHATMRGYEDRYGHASAASGRLVVDAVQKIGLQIMIGVRWMRLVRDLRIPFAAKITSRMMRHLYGSDIHWDSEFDAGVAMVHGMGLAISHAARVGAGCILFQNVCLGLGIDPVTRESGAPTLGARVVVGPGATLLGPITIGDGTKIMAGCTVTSSVPPNSVVESPVPSVRSRVRAADPPSEAKPSS